MSKDLFDLPEGWSWQPLSALAEIVSGGTPSREVAEYWSPTEIAWVTPTDITGSDGRHLASSKERISKAGLQKSSAAMLPVGTVLMTSRATLGQAKISAVECCTNQGFKSLVPKTGVPSEYLYYLVQLFKTRYEQLGIGSTFLEVSKKDTEKFMLPVAPEGQRTSIAKILGCVDNQIDVTQALIDKYTAIKQGMMADLFSRGIDPETKALRPTFEEAPELYHKTPLGMLPKGWELVRTETVAREVVVGIVIEPSKYYTSEGVPVFRSANIQENKINPRNFVHMSEESNQLNRKSMLRTGDVITVRTGYPGTTCVVTEEYDRSNAVDIIITRLGENVIPDFFSLWVNSDSGKGQVLSAQGGLAQQHFNVGEMKNLLVPRISLSEQELILKTARSLLKKIELETHHLLKLKLQKQGLMQDLLTGKVPVPA
ncbi:restriction endonuclease subunit S [Vibrio vulnificus]|uniref:restriction endonuclease subunit S n=1 Tax=Vibrio vulnificus TaxID=672 RepID=UPI00165E46EB|nr:restriction endonuclease subunit S [Vibrio vulnificus]EGR9006586.1 restriction endonuclease subunit S [Vibrio vulnificus]EHU9456739.1 restriction endonuclease subunit S [Vibrio vulnificus]EJT0553112.1 restriction endonuclease subunit S [Vibrio vulnificus]HAS8256246.1 restriction endonuclease subunit S [Vibrio vulnificus]